jgi:multidrug efflux system membrane fusion protein
LLAPIAAALVVRGLLNGAPAPSRRPPPLVQTAPVVRGSMEERYPVSAEVRPLLSVEVRPEVSGTIQRLYFQEGTEVRRGDPLAQINPTPYQVALDQARANTSRARARIGEAQAQRRLAEAQLRLASDRARRYVGLSRQGALSRDDEENYRTQELVARANLAALEGSAASAEAELAAARAAEAAARLNLDHTLLRSPISGRIGQQRISPGNLVREQEDKPLVVINQTSPLDAVFGIPQRWEERISVGQRLRIEGRPGLEGRIVSLDNTTNASTGTVLAKARLEGNTAGLTPGETVNASLLVRRLDGALLLPSRAVQRGQEGPFVYGARQGKAVLVPVKVLASDGRRTAVEADLQPGEPVVVAGQFALTPGGPLRTGADRKGRGGGEPGRRQQQP